MNYIYHGNSMKRVFQAGDVPELREIPFHEFRRGDIVCFRRPRQDRRRWSCHPRR